MPVSDAPTGKEDEHTETKAVPPASTGGAAAASGQSAEKTGQPAEKPGGPAEKKVESLRDYVALWPLLILCVGGGAWLKAHAQGVVEVSGTVLAAIGTATFLWNLVPEDTRKKARLDFVQKFKSRTIARVAWWTCAAALVPVLFLSSVHVSAKEDRTPVTIFLMNGAVDGASVVGGRADLTKAKPTASFLLAVTPLGRSRWLRSSSEDRSSQFRLFPILPRKLAYPDDFDPPVVAVVLPTGGFIADFGQPSRPRLVVRGDAGRGDTIATDSMTKIEALMLSVDSVAPPDTATMRPRWTAEVRELLGVDERDAQDQVNDWVRFRAIRTRRALRTGETISVVVLSPAGDTLAAKSLTLSKPFSDVILRRRTD